MRNKKIAVFILLFLFLVTAFCPVAKPQDDSLKLLIQNKKGKARIDILDSLATLFYKNNELNKANKHLQQAWQLAKKNDYTAEEAQAADKLGNIYNRLNNPDSALWFYQQAYKLYKQIEMRTDLARVASKIGIRYGKTSRYEKALKYLQEALNVYLEKEDKEGIAKLYTAIGTIFYYQQDFKNARGYFENALKTEKQLNDTSDIIVLLSNLSTVFESEGDTLKAIDLQYEAAELARKQDKKEILGFALMNLGALYFNSSRYDEALELYQESLEIFKILNLLEYQAYLYNNISLIEIRDKHNEQAKAYLQNALRITNKLTMPALKMEVLLNLSKISESENRYKESFEYYRKYTSIKDSLQDTDRNVSIMELQMKYDTEKVKASEAQQRQKAERARFHNAVLIGLIALTLIVILFLIRIYHTKKRVAKNLEEKNREISRQKGRVETALRELKESQQQNIGILETIPDLFFLLDQDYRFIKHNESKNVDMMLSPSDFMNKKVDECFPENLAKPLVRTLNKAKETGKLQFLEYSLEVKGSMHIYEARIMPTPQMQYLVLIRDITERNNIENDLRKAKEEAEKATEMKSMFLASLSHEIRTPLSSIIGIAGVLEETELTEEQQEFLNVINISGNNLMNLINNILDFSKIESGQLELGKIEFNIPEVIGEVLSVLNLQAEEADVTLSADIEKNVPNRAIGDPMRLKQILINLINNAIKFTKKGKVNIHLQKFDEDETSFRLKFNVVDTGIGVAVEQRDKLFKAFSQANSFIARKYGGTGLGLAISKHFATMMGGDIGVQSESGKGSDFWFTVVFDKTDNQKQKPPEKNKRESADRSKKDMGKMNVLLVEDNLLNQKFAQAILIKNDHKVDIAENGKIGVELFEKNNYDIILMDIQMPVMDGIEATKKIRAIENEKNLAPIRIVAVTAYAMEGDEEKFYRAGIDDYLRKPYKTHQLIEKLHN